MRDGDWKLVRPRLAETMRVPDIHWLWVSMYRPEHFEANGVLHPPDPAVRAVPAAPELYNVAEDPQEQRNLAGEFPDRTHRMLRALEDWFEEVEAERATIMEAAR
jgi:hypothetical protein